MVSKMVYSGLRFDCRCGVVLCWRIVVQGVTPQAADPCLSLGTRAARRSQA